MNIELSKKLCQIQFLLVSKEQESGVSLHNSNYFTFKYNGLYPNNSFITLRARVVYRQHRGQVFIETATRI